jgi:hypothetical protein
MRSRSCLKLCPALRLPDFSGQTGFPPKLARPGKSVRQLRRLRTHAKNKRATEEVFVPDVPRLLRWIALLLAAFVAFREITYYLEHSRRAGPSATIAVLAVAVVLVALSGIGKYRS